jgi:glyoxylase-like metal-dependent hydrolase (beta-lactamase superfamily II)
LKILDEAGFAVYMVGGGGMGVSHQTDAHTYVLDAGGELALIDAGSGIKPELIRRNLVRDDLDERRISTIVLTHSHWDHARGCRFWREQTGARVAGHEDAVEVIERTLWPDVHITRHGVPSAASKVDVRLRDGSRVRVGKLDIEVIHTPGHNDDAICLFASFGSHRVLFSGDTVFAEGGHGTVTADTNFRHYRDSVKRLVAYGTTALLPGHRQFVLSEGNEHVKLLAKKLSGRWTDVTDTRVPFFPTWWLEHDPSLYEDAKQSHATSIGE